jgi:transcriptional regulator with XRE-family HTH domain
MGTPLGDFVRAKRDTIRPESVGLPERDRARAPGLRRSDLATRSGISVEYLTRIEQGRDRNPSGSVLNALADGLSLDAAERVHLRYLAKITGGACPGGGQPAPPPRDVRPAVLETLRMLEPGVALVTNRVGDVLAYTTGVELLLRGVGLLEAAEPNLTRYVFTDPRARSLFLDWDQVADEQAFDLWLGPSAESSQWLQAELAPVAGPEFTRRLGRHIPPPRVALRLQHPIAGELRWQRETLELRSTDAQQIVVFLPADESTSRAMEQLRRRPRGTLRAVT